MKFVKYNIHIYKKKRDITKTLENVFINDTYLVHPTIKSSTDGVFFLSSYIMYLRHLFYINIVNCHIIIEY